MSNVSTTNKNALVLDFDGTIYHNKKEDFSVNINFHDILSARAFFDELLYQIPQINLNNTDLILITGRPAHQQKLILYLLRQKGYNIAKSYFLPEVKFFPGLQGDEDSIFIHYWFWKINILSEIRQSQEYNTITVIDDDNVICAMLKKLDFNVIKAHFDSCGPFPQLFFTPMISKTDSELIQIRLVNR